MPIRQPELLPSTHYRRPVGVATGGAMAETHKAIILNAAKQECRAFVKHFPSIQTRSLFNEWFGYCLMAALGVPQPAAAIMPAPRLGSSPGLLDWAFVSFMPTPVCEGTPKEIYDLTDATQLKVIADRLMQCHAFAGMVAADQLCMNYDRNIGNIVFTGPKSFVTIDHNQILGGNSWQRDDLLKPTGWVRSVPMDLCNQCSTIPRGTANALIASAEVTAEALWSCFAELQNALTQSNPTDAHLALNAVWWRSLELTDWFKQKLNVML